MTYRIYNSIILIPLGILMTIFVCLGIWMEPFDGGLTRVGGFMERDFGWNEPQKYFSTMQYASSKGNKYSRYYDVVVLRDSFSISFPHAQWQNHFVARTELSLITYDLEDIDINSFVSSPEYLAHPPRIVIYETVERSFVGRGKSWYSGDCQPAPSPQLKWKPLSTQSLSPKLLNHTRNTQTGFMHPNMSTGVHFLKRVIKKTFNEKSNRTIKLKLTRSDLFTNRLKDFLLVFRSDFDRYLISKDRLDQAICGFYSIQNTFQGSGTTFFVGIVAPDKLTAYFDLIQDFDREKIHWATELAKHPQLNLVPLLKALKEEIAKGTQDVYLPNDTHWGSAGMRVTSDALYQYLLDQGILKKDTKANSD